MKTRWLVCALMLGVGAAQAQTPKQALEKWQTFADKPHLETAILGAHQALAVFYRAGDDGIDVPVNVFVNGRYQASLLANTFSARAVCADKQALGVSLSHADGFEPVRVSARETLPVGEMAFFKVANNVAGQPEIVRVSPNIARADLAGTKMLTHTLSRTPAAANLNCQALVLQTANFSASTLFGFNEYEYEGIRESANESLMQLSQKINELGESRVQKVVVAGHTDPEGADDYNLALSHKRAITIQAALQKMGRVSVPIEAVGLGERELKVDNCATLHPRDAAARHVCNQPNRRVEVTVYGR